MHSINNRPYPRSQRGSFLLSVLIALGILGVILPGILQFLKQSIAQSSMQSIEADLEDLRSHIRSRFDCDKTKAHLVAGKSQADICKELLTGTQEFYALNKQNNELLEKDQPNNQKNWIASYHIKFQCKALENLDPLQHEGLHFMIRKERVPQPPAPWVAPNEYTDPSIVWINPLTNQKMPWTKLFAIPICEIY